MKTFLIASLIIFTNYFSSNAQQGMSHFSERPPANPGYPYVRGMFVDCSADIIHDVSNGSPLGLSQQLLDYIQKNYIGYIVMCGLEYSNIFGNSVLENALRDFIRTARSRFGNLQIGIAGSDETFFTQTPYLKVPDEFGKICFPGSAFDRTSDLEKFINDSGNNFSELKRSEISKFFLRASQFKMNVKNARSPQPCEKAFDALYLQYRYWNQTSSLSAMQHEFDNFKNILSAMKLMKCSYTCIDNIDAEFLPTELFNLQAWTAITQITEADPMIDRMMIPCFTNDLRNVFNISCKTYHFLSDRFSKPGTKFFAEMSAESPSFRYCSSSLTPNNYLGDYLNGSVSPSGNMFSVERYFLNQFNQSNYICPACNCAAYDDDHQSASLPDGNILSGTMWLTYSLLNSNNLARQSVAAEINDGEKKLISLQLISITGELIGKFLSVKELTAIEKDHKIKNGIYIVRKYFSDGSVIGEKLGIVN